MDRDARIFVAGHRGLAGSAIVRALTNKGYTNLLLRSRADLDLRRRGAVMRFFQKERPAYVVLAAAKVGGILANERSPADFGMENLAITTSVLDAAHETGVQKLLFLGSSCAYPRLAPQPMKEEHLFTGPPEPTNRAYAVAKLAGVVLCDSYDRQHGTNFVVAMPTNLYGPGDRYHPEDSHVIPALIRKLHEAKESGAPQATLWGTGAPRREVLHADDLGRACVRLLEAFDAPRGSDGGDGVDRIMVNVGTGEEHTIAELAALVAEVVGYRGELLWDATMPGGTPRKLLDSSKIRALGWAPEVPLLLGLEGAYRDYLSRFPRTEAAS